MSASGCVSKWLARVVSSADLAVQFGDDGHCGAGGGSERRGADRSWRGQLFGAQGGLDFAGAGGDIALTPTAFERGLVR